MTSFSYSIRIYLLCIYFLFIYFFVLPLSNDKPSSSSSFFAKFKTKIHDLYSCIYIYICKTRVLSDLFLSMKLLFFFLLLFVHFISFSICASGFCFVFFFLFLQILLNFLFFFYDDV